jgi:uncharacterized protein (TIGR03089 family)
VTTFPEVLARLRAGDAGRPLVTFYDDASGERTELSVTTYATWVAKVAALLAEELDLEPGDRLLVDLPPHWLGTVVLGAAWSVGLEVVREGAHAAVVTGPDGLTRWADEAYDVPVVASALLPLAGRFPRGVPAGVHDLGVEVWSQPDAYDAWPGPQEDTPAFAGVVQADLWREPTAERLLSVHDPATLAGHPSFTGPLAGGGSLVLVVQATPERLATIAAEERATRRFDPSDGGAQPPRS